MTTLKQDERVAIARLHALLELLPSALDKELASSGLTAFEFTLLEALAEAPNHRLRLTALASKTNATLPRLSRVVTGLEGKGLIARMPCAEDGRATNAVMTGRGLGAHDVAAPVYADAVRRLVLDALSARPGGVAQLADVSLAVLDALDPAGKLAVTAEGRECAADPVSATA